MIKLMGLLLMAGALAVGAAGCAPGQPMVLRIAPDPGASHGAEQIMAQLPATVRFNDRMGSVHVASLDAAIPTSATGVEQGVRTGPLAAGDLVYWASGPALLVVLVDGVEAPDGGVLALGRVEEGFQTLYECHRGCEAELHLDHTTGDDR